MYLCWKNHGFASARAWTWASVPLLWKSEDEVLPQPQLPFLLRCPTYLCLTLLHVDSVSLSSMDIKAFILLQSGQQCRMCAALFPFLFHISLLLIPTARHGCCSSFLSYLFYWAGAAVLSCSLFYCLQLWPPGSSGLWSRRIWQVALEVTNVQGCTS